MQTLIAYYSYTGHNAFLARELQKRLDCDVYAIVEPALRPARWFLLNGGRNPKWRNV